MTVTWRKIEIFNIQDGGCRHLENRFFGHNRLSDFSDILYEEAERHVNKGYMTKTANFLKSKMADDRHFVNRKIAISQWKIVRFDEIWYTTLDYWTRWQPRDQKLKFLKFKMAVAAILKIAFFFINRLSDFSNILYEEAERHVNKGYVTKTANF